MRVRDRRIGLGASEVPVIAGISPYTTPVELWLKKTGGPEQPDNGAMAVGRALEVPLLRLLASQQGLTLRHNAVTRTHAAWPEVPLYATPDAIGPAGTYLGEIKVVGRWNEEEWSGGVPGHIRLQVQAQMAVHRNAEYTVVAALLNGTDFRVERVDRDLAVIEELERRVVEWWRDYVVAGTPPDPTGEKDRWALLKAMVATVGRQERPATPEENGLAEAYDEANRRAKLIAGNAKVLRLLLAEAAAETDLRGPGWTGRWHDLQGTPVFTVRVQDAKKELVP